MGLDGSGPGVGGCIGDNPKAARTYEVGASYLIVASYVLLDYCPVVVLLIS